MSSRTISNFNILKNECMFLKVTQKFAMLIDVVIGRNITMGSGFPIQIRIFSVNIEIRNHFGLSTVDKGAR